MCLSLPFQHTKTQQKTFFCQSGALPNCGFKVVTIGSIRHPRCRVIPFCGLVAKLYSFLQDEYDFEACFFGRLLEGRPVVAAGPTAARV
jgi:hypothetical protein